MNPESTPPETTEPESRSGKLLGVSGFSYESGSEAGTTSDDGQFQYRTDQEVTFSLGGIVLGSTMPKDYITLEDIAGDHPDALSNLQRFLVTIDYDLSPMNGIVVTPAIHTAATEDASLNFNQSSESFTVEAEALLQTELKSQLHADALQHLPLIHIRRCRRAEK